MDERLDLLVSHCRQDIYSTTERLVHIEDELKKFDDPKYDTKINLIHSIYNDLDSVYNKLKNLNIEFISAINIPKESNKEEDEEEC